MEEQVLRRVQVVLPMASNEEIRAASRIVRVMYPWDAESSLAEKVINRLKSKGYNNENVPNNIAAPKKPVYLDLTDDMLFDELPVQRLAAKPPEPKQALPGNQTVIRPTTTIDLVDDVDKVLNVTAFEREILNRISLDNRPKPAKPETAPSLPLERVQNNPQPQKVEILPPIPKSGINSKEGMGKPSVQGIPGTNSTAPSGKPPVAVPQPAVNRGPPAAPIPAITQSVKQEIGQKIVEKKPGDLKTELFAKVKNQVQAVIPDVSEEYIRKCFDDISRDATKDENALVVEILNHLFETPAYPKLGASDDFKQAVPSMRSPLKNYKDDNPEIECGCCMTDYPFEQMIQCSEGHLFCKDCLSRYVSTKVFEEGVVDIHCMDTDSGCKAGFPLAMLRLALPPKTLEGFQQRLQDAEIRKANLSDLAQCPFCDFKAIVDDPKLDLFVCQNQACLKKSCLRCKRVDHLPFTCQQMEDKEKEDKSDSYRKRMEEAMTLAALRICQKCKTPYVKTDGCNRVKCPTCPNMYICYICQKHDIPYEHFCKCSRSLMTEAKCKKCGECHLWLKDTGKYDESLAAARKAEEANKMQEELSKQNFQVDLSKVGAINLPLPQDNTIVGQIKRAAVKPARNKRPKKRARKY